MIKNKILVICSLMPWDLTRIHGLVTKTEVEDIMIKNKIRMFYESKKESISSYNDNQKLYEYFKTLKDKYKDKITFVNQEIDNKFKAFDIEAINLQGNLFEYYCDDCNLVHDMNVCSNCDNVGLFYNISLKEDKRQYAKVVDLINEAQNLIFIGNVSELDPTLYIDDFIETLYINTEDVKYSGSNPYISNEDKDKNIGDFFNKKHIVENLNDSIDIIDTFVKHKLNTKVNVNIKNPYKNNGVEIIQIVNDYFSYLQTKHSISNEHYDKRLVKVIRKTYPFTKHLPELYVHNIWFAYCYDTKRDPLNIFYDDLFYDMLLVYSKYRWDGVKKYFTIRPKVSLTISYNQGNEKAIKLFQKLLFKDDNHIQFN